MKQTFRGGVHPNDMKALSKDAPLRAYNATGEMVFLLSQHIGKPAKPVVSKNDPVRVGQCIAEADGFISANVISSCSGKVKAIEKRRTISGAMMDAIVVENDGLFTLDEGIGERVDDETLSNEEIVNAVKRAGIVGLGGAGFPTHVKLMPKNPAMIRFIIANGAECEPYLTCNDRLMREKPGEILEGLAIMLRLFEHAVGVICIEKNKKEAIEAMKTASASFERIKVLALDTKYPQGGEHSLIQVVTGADYPVSMLPADVGCIVDNVGTIYAIGRAVRYNEPLYRHVMTLSGDGVNEPANLIVRDGTMVRELIEANGGLKEGEVKKVLAGGPMMGFALGSLDVPVVKTTNGLTVLKHDGVEEAEKKMTACLRCGRCTTVCPTGLLPELMAEAAEAGNLERYEKKLYGLECVACGSCSFICPARRPLTETFKRVKAEIMAKKRAEQAGGKK